MSGVAVVPYSLAQAPGAGSKFSKKRKKSLSSSSVGASSSMAEAGWAKVDIEDMQLDGFQDGCAFELEELTGYRVEATEDGGKMLIEDSKIQQEQRGRNKKKRRKVKTTKKQYETEKKGDVDTEEKKDDHKTGSKEGARA
ncbi:unnamed protein product [Peronospora destructor]|uniref:Uncharacterized protein n=1 Tax=Peronospora destructor TaxID=86335 RepID=A0AAV0TAM6_9STRA|nr:unnamed protein product [Peronospora destructor]